MNKRARFLILFAFLISSPSFSFTKIPAQVVNKEISCPADIVYLISELGYILGKDVNRHKLIQDIGAIPRPPIYEPYVSKVLSATRQQGIFLLAFKLSPDLNSLKELKNHGKPFIAYLKDEGYCLVREIIYNDIEGFSVSCTNSESQARVLEGDVFIDRWNGHIFSLPLVNILAEKISSDIPQKGRVIFAYSYHKEDFDKLKKILDPLCEKSIRSGKKLIYIDELGLIPKDSVKKTRENFKLTEKEAFERAKKSLAEEIERFERGISTYDENPFYQAQYSYLAKHKIKSYMEDLDYENWKHIVAFDDLNIHNKATRAFCMGDTKAYLKRAKEYNKGFWLYNVKERDEIFRRQIEKIAREYPESFIVTLRGIGHFGMEEKLILEDFTVETFVIADGDFNENLVSDQMGQVMLSNEVNIELQEERLLILRSFPEECLRTYLQKTIADLTLATRLAKRIVDRMNEKEIKRLSRDISYAFAKGTINNTEQVWEYVYNWAKARGKIIPEEITDR